MTKSKNVADASLGDVSEDLSVDQVEKWLTDDLGRALSLLHALHNDKNALKLIAVHLHGLALNHKTKGDPSEIHKP